jgi:hypothetical protein
MADFAVRIVRVADLDREPRQADARDALGVEQRGGNRVGVRAYEADRFRASEKYQFAVNLQRCVEIFGMCERYGSF